jgi:hypothetical protein
MNSFYERPIGEMMEEIGGSPEKVAAEKRKHFREMETLALSNAFSLRHGWEKPVDPEGFDQAVKALTARLQSRAEEIQEFGARLDKAKEQENKPGSDLMGHSKSFIRFLLQEDLGRDLKGQKFFGEEWDESQAAHEESMGALALQALQSLGVAEKLSQRSWREEMARLIGNQKSQQELAIGPQGLVNRQDHYSIAPRRGEGGAFERFETVDWSEGNSGLTSDVPDPGRRLGRGSYFNGPMMFSMSGSEKRASQGATRLTLGLACPRGGLVDEKAFSDERGGLPMFFLFGSLRAKMDKATQEVKRQARWCASGSAALACLEWGIKAQEGSALAQVVDHLKEVALAGDELALQDKARRVCEWFDEVAGERASALALKVWGGSVPSGMRLGELETLAKYNKELWASLEGQEALGLFSIRMAQHLGLELSGRDLPDRAKQKMKERGLSEGGWRLLGKMDSDPEGVIAQWMGAAKDDNALKAFFDHELLHSISAELSFNEGAGVEDIERVRERKQQEVERRRKLEEEQKVALVARALSACAARGMDGPSAERALKAFFENSDARDTVFGFKLKAPDHAQASEVERERLAKELRMPRILGDWLSLAAKNPNKAVEALSQARDWARDAEWGAWSEMPENAGWQEVMTRQKRWHEMVQTRERSEKAAKSWDGMSPGWSDPQTGFSAIPLTDGGMLWDEGKAMHHCVSSYDEECEEGRSRIFSIRKDGERFGTAEVRVDDGSFKVVQFNGAYNKPIDDERAWAAAKGAAAQCKEAARMAPSPKTALNLQEEESILRRLIARRLPEVAAAEPRVPMAPPGGHL